jgi:hypothetical protein
MLIEASTPLIAPHIEGVFAVFQLSHKPQTSWISVDEQLPPVGKQCLFYRPLAEMTGDRIIAVKTATKDMKDCWRETVPDGCEPCNPSSGACHVTHWMPLPEPPLNKQDR